MSAMVIEFIHIMYYIILYPHTAIAVRAEDDEAEAHPVLI